ncbi:MAG: hypothetical protein A3J93_04825 [Candidatus Magasanikbacteria bacterium RIFOXYC2_FULL_42_28]|uniref:Methyltransferase type 11 domain-containing protein n=1 Tax=Candidatus Magasanikbacteria bacterium RIFOXYC2_FULL_42_28 TaxID=1798704 RepID=A0A1F6NWP8_9BACT|nr:MAG: hypothetical protein A3J93_04825 [Candidatus Magasanikbacteria bacterium RIFOXYC2_FULL_42_28]
MSATKPFAGDTGLRVEPGPEYKHLIPSNKYTPKDVFKDKEVVGNVCSLLIDLFDHLGLDDDKSQDLVEQIIKIGEEAPDDVQLETSLKLLLSEAGLNEKIAEKLIDRAEKIFGQIKDFVVGDVVYDVGAGDGKVGEAIHDRQGKEVILLDVIDYNKTDLPLVEYNGTELPRPDNSADTTLLLTVLHHCDEPEKVLDEAIRVTDDNGNIILIESVYTSEQDRKLQTFLDWFYNRVLHDKVNCPYNFNSPDGWRKVFAEKGLELVDCTDLGRDQKTVPEHHYRFVVKVIK